MKIHISYEYIFTCLGVRLEYYIDLTHNNFLSLYPLLIISLWKQNKKKTVILGGGDYACFTAKALSSMGQDVYLVTTRPMSLKDTPLNPLRGSKGEKYEWVYVLFCFFLFLLEN